MKRIFIDRATSPVTIMIGWWSVALTLAVADQATKYAIRSDLPDDTTIVVSRFFNVVHRWNTGAAFSLLANGGGWQRYFLIALALAASAFLVWMLCKPLPKLEALGYSLILGGALGNAMDRIIRGYVTDFFDFHWQNWHWPAFNLADIGIFIGAASLIGSAFFVSRDQKSLY